MRSIALAGLLVIASCGGDTDDAKSGSAGSGGTTSGGSSGTTSGGSSGANTGGSSGTAGSAGVAGAPAATVTCFSVSAPQKECTPEQYCCDSSCIPDDTPCTGSAFHCDDATDCPGAFCCVTKLSHLDGGAQVATCQAACDPDAQLIVCHDLSSATGCPPGMTCEITATLPAGYGYCCGSQPCSAI